MRSFRTTVSFKARINNCGKQGDEFVVGATVEEVADSGIFNFFESTYNLVMEISRDLVQQEHRSMFKDGI
jgi:hypothetical protein